MEEFPSCAVPNDTLKKKKKEQTKEKIIKLAGCKKTSSSLS